MIATGLKLALLFAYDPTVIGQVAVFLLMLAVLVVFHEFGHFVFAKRFGVTVEEFAVGFGPRIASITRGGTAYSINLLPLGGYCKMRGEDTADDGSADPGNFQHKKLWQRIVIILAGPVFNLILAVLIFAFVGFAIGVPTGRTNVIDSIVSNSPAARAGLEPGDQIVMFDGQPVKSGDELVEKIHHQVGKPVSIDVRRGSTIRHYELTTMASVQPDGTTVGIIGFLPKTQFEHSSMIGSVVFGFSQVVESIVVEVTSIAGAISHHDVSDLHGTVGVARLVIEEERAGAFYVLMTAGLLSVVLALFNLLPIPALDGGRIAFLLVEGVRGRPVDPEKEGLVHLTGFALIMLLFIVVTYRDIAQWVTGKGGM